MLNEMKKDLDNAADKLSRVEAKRMDKLHEIEMLKKNNDI